MKKISGARELRKIAQVHAGDTVYLPCDVDKGILPKEVRVVIPVDEMRQCPIRNQPAKRFIYAFTPKSTLVEERGAFFIPVIVTRFVYASKPKPGMNGAQIFVPGNPVSDNFGVIGNGMLTPIGWLVKAKLTRTLLT